MDSAVNFDFENGFVSKHEIREWISEGILKCENRFRSTREHKIKE